MHVFLYFLIINFLLLKCSSELISEEHEHGLCRQCGSEVACLDFINNIDSPEALIVRNTSILSEGREAKVQTLINKAGIIFSVFTVKTANCQTVAEWQLANTWFPGFYWSPCACPQCGHHLGWAFKRDLKGKHADFFGLIESNILRERFVDKLLVVPKIS